MGKIRENFVVGSFLEVLSCHVVLEHRTLHVSGKCSPIWTTCLPLGEFLVLLWLLLLNRHDIYGYKIVHEWVSVIQCSNTHPFTSVHFLPAMSPVSLQYSSLHLPTSVTGTFLLSICLSLFLFPFESHISAFCLRLLPFSSAPGALSHLPLAMAP